MLKVECVHNYTAASSLIVAYGRDFISNHQQKHICSRTRRSRVSGPSFFFSLISLAAVFEMPAGEKCSQTPSQGPDVENTAETARDYVIEVNRCDGATLGIIVDTSDGFRAKTPSTKG